MLWALLIQHLLEVTFASKPFSFYKDRIKVEVSLLTLVNAFLNVKFLFQMFKTQ